MFQRSGGGGTFGRFLMTDDERFFTATPSVTTLHRRLASADETEQLEAMKHLTAHSVILDASEMRKLFVAVTKLCRASRIELRKLAYAFLVRFSADDPDAALLCVASLQRDLDSHSAHVRALGLKTLCGLRVPAAEAVVSFALRRMLKDHTVLVRRCAVLSLARHGLSISETRNAIKEAIAAFEPSILGAGLVAFRQVCPDDWDLLHPHFHRLVTTLPRLVPFDQSSALLVLTRYARHHFTDPAGDTPLCPDHALLLERTRPLVRSPAWAPSAQLVLRCGLQADREALVPTLVWRASSGSSAERLTALSLLCEVARSRDIDVSSAFDQLLLQPNDPRAIRRLKLRLLVHFIPGPLVRRLATHLKMHLDGSRNSDWATQLDCLEGITALALAAPQFAPLVLQLATHQLLRGRWVATAAARSLRAVLRCSVDPAARTDTLTRIMRWFLSDKLSTTAETRSIVLAILRELSYMSVVRHHLPDVVRVAASRFPCEARAVRLESLRLLAVLPAADQLSLDGGEVTRLARLVDYMKREAMSSDDLMNRELVRWCADASRFEPPLPPRRALWLELDAGVSEADDEPWAPSVRGASKRKPCVLGDVASGLIDGDNAMAQPPAVSSPFSDDSEESYSGSENSTDNVDDVDSLLSAAPIAVHHVRRGESRPS